MTFRDRIKKRSSELIISEIKQNGFVRVACPGKVIDKVLKYTGVELKDNNGSLVFKYNQLKLDI